MRKTRSVIVIGVLMGTLLGFLILSDPSKLPLPLLIVPFILLYALIYTIIKHSLMGRLVKMNRKQRTVIAGVGASVPALLLMLQSIHQLTIRDVFVVFSLAAVAAFYISRADFIQ